MRPVLTALLAALALTGCTSPLPTAEPTAARPATSAAVAPPTGDCAPADPEPPVSAEPLKLAVMTYNVLGGTPPSEWFPQIDPAELDPMVREPATVALIEHVDADVIGLQEYRPEEDSGAKLIADLDQYTWVSPGPQAGPEAVSVPILYRTGRFDCLATGHEKVTSVDDPGSMLDRYVNWVRLLDHESGRTFFVFNYHAHPWQTTEFAALRSAAIDHLIEVVKQVNPGFAEPFAITGDFNARSRETRPGYRDHLRKLPKEGIVDTATLAAKDTSDIPRAASMNKMSAKVAGEYVGKVVRRNGSHIDYVWVPEGTKVRSWATVTGPDVTWRRIRGEKVPVWTGVVPSDHSPVVARLRFPKP